MSIAQRVRIWQQRLRSMFRQEALDAELTRELSFHFEELVKEQLAEGKSPAEARRAAHRALGNAAALAEQCRDQRRVAWFHDLQQDLLYGLRMLRKAPVFTLLAVASLGLGIGANVAILGAFDRVLLDTLPFPNADRLVIARAVPPDNPGQPTNAALLDFVAWRDRNTSFDAIGASLADQRNLGAEDGEPAERIEGQLFSAGVFQALGIRPLLGRVFTDDEAQADTAAKIVVISHRLWTRRFGADPAVLGRQIRLNGVPTAIVGVMPPEFAYPVLRAEYWAPMRVGTAQLPGAARFFRVVGRLKSGVTAQQAEANLQSASIALANDFPDRVGWGVQLQAMRDAMFGWTLVPLLTLQVAVALILLIACANVAGLLLARGTVRGPEIAMRMSLGAGRGRIIRQLMAESLLLSLIGGAAGILVAWWGLRGFVVMNPPLGAPPIGELALTPRMFGLIVALAGATTLLFGIAPALASSNVSLTTPISEMARSSGTPRQQYLRGALVAAQISLALVLLVGAGLLVASFVRLAERELNFEPRGLLTFEYRIPGGEFLRPIGSYHGFPYYEIAPQPSLVIEQLYDHLHRVPGAVSVAGISHRPLNSLLVPAMAVTVEGDASAARAASPPMVSYLLVTPNYFATMRATIARGREFDIRDARSAPWVAVVNETAAAQLWPGENPIGKRLRLDIIPEEQSREVVGVVHDLPLGQAQTDSKPVVYASYLQQPTRYRGPWAPMLGQMTFLLRTAGYPLDLVSAARKAVADIDPDRPIASIAPVMFDIELGLRRRRQFAFVLSGFALAATLLAGIGVYGLMAYSVELRTREIGIRRSLGATSRDVSIMVGRYAAVLVAGGLTGGLVGAFGLTRLIASQLWRVTPTDPRTYAGVSLLLVLVALLAALVPVRRAVRVDPTVALKYE